MSIYEVILLEELVDRIGYDRTHPEYCRKCIAPRTQVCDLTQEFHAVTFLLKRIICFRSSFDHDVLRFDFKRLLRVRRQDKRSRHAQSCRHRCFRNFFEVVQKFCFIHDLYGFKKRTVIQLYKSKFIGSAICSDPTLYYDFLICILFAFPKKTFDFYYIFHLYFISCQ